MNEKSRNFLEGLTPGDRPVAIANRHILKTIGDRCSAGDPKEDVMDDKLVWIVQLLWWKTETETIPISEIVIDIGTYDIVSSPTKEDVHRIVKNL